MDPLPWSAEMLPAVAPPSRTCWPLARAAARLLAAAPPRDAAAQQAVPPGGPRVTPLDGYVAEGLKNNLALAQARLRVQRSEAAVKQARGAFLPSLGVDARYSRTAGNVVNIGDLVNPAYGALNQLIGRDAFPTNVDARLPLTQETRLRLVQPIYQPAIRAGYRIAEGQRQLQEAELGAARRRLAADIRLAYLNHARATQVVALYEATVPLVAENRRVNERLVANGRATPDAALRAAAEESEVAQQLAAARDQQSAAARYFNFLLNRPLGAPIELVADSLLDPGEPPGLDDALRTALLRREELRQVEEGERIAERQQQLARASFLPGVAAAVDYGVQGGDYRFGRSSDFAIATLTLQWNLFNGGQDQARVEQAALDARRYRTQRQELARQVELEVETAYENATVARQAIATATSRLTSADRSFRLVQRRYAEGLATLVEFIDARTSYTSAGLNRVVTVYDYLARRVDLDRAAALYPSTPPTSTR